MANGSDDNYECDALVVGSGAAGMSAAVTAGHRGLNVLIVEKEPRFGGTTARSGGWLWIPGTSLARAWGITESPDQARTYLRHEAGNSFDAARVDAFLTAGPEAVDFFTAKTAVRFDMPLTFPDYHVEAPGGAQGGRSMVTRPFDGHELGEHIKDLRSPLPELTVFGMMLGSGKEIIHFMRATKSFASAFYVAKRLSKHAMDGMRYGRGMNLTNGNALAGRLAKSAFDLRIPLWLSSQVRELIVEDGAVRGAIGSVTYALMPLRMAKKLDPYRETARMALEPWLVEAALTRLDGRLSPADQRTIVRATRTPHKVKWPDLVKRTPLICRRQQCPERASGALPWGADPGCSRAPDRTPTARQ